MPHEPDSAFVGTQLVRVEDPARNDKGAVITRGGLVDRPVDPDLVSFLHMLEAPDRPVMRGHDMHSRSSLFERPLRTRQFRLFKADRRKEIGRAQGRERGWQYG